MRAKGTILHEFPLSPVPNKIVKGSKVNGRDGVTGTDNSSRGERKSNRLAHANFMGHQLRRIFYDTLLRKQNSGAVPSWLEGGGGAQAECPSAPA